MSVPPGPPTLNIRAPVTALPLGPPTREPAHYATLPLQTASEHLLLAFFFLWFVVAVVITCGWLVLARSTR